jgi:hypothetical protein
MTIGPAPMIMMVLMSVRFGMSIRSLLRLPGRAAAQARIYAHKKRPHFRPKSRSAPSADRL